ncbi:MAG: DUF3843 family protein [Parabacteroides sp.]
MKNIKIFPKDWLQLHPYKQSNPVDSYYTNIANRIYDILVQTELINSFEGDEAKQVSIRMAAYFEDVISELGIWRAFITTAKELYGKYLPFYTPDDHYYDDEANLEDVRFLLWHFTQQYHGYRKSTFVSPDNPTNEWAARLIYKIFWDEWTTAPENNRMKALFSKESVIDSQETYEPLLFWFHYNMYLMVDANQELKEQTQSFWNSFSQSPEKLNAMIMTLHQQLAYTSKCSFLAMTSPEWLLKVIPQDHPNHAFFQEVVEGCKPNIPEDVVTRNKENYEKFQQAAEGKLLVYFDQVAAAEQFLTEKVGMNLPDGHLPEDLAGEKLAIYATEKEGVQLIHTDVDCIKDENNPFYDAKAAAAKGIGYFIVRHCSPVLLKEMEARNMLEDAQAKSLRSPERAKAIIHENVPFLVNYFLKEAF